MKKRTKRLKAKAVLVNELAVALDRAYLQILEFLNEGQFAREIVFDAGYIVDALAKVRGKHE